MALFGPKSAAMAGMVAIVGAQSFNMYPDIGADGLASALGFSVECLDALNVTVECDSDLYRMSGQVDMYFWSSENLTDLCTSNCLQSSSDWMENVYNVCGDNDTISIDGKLVPVETVAERYSDGVGLACLTDQELEIWPIGVNTTDDSTTTATSVLTTASTTSSLVVITDEPSPNVTESYGTIPDPIFCFLELQTWLGADVDPDCTSDPDNIFCTDPTSQTRIANLYNDTILCSNCFLSVMWWRINSPFLPDSDYSDYLIEQYQDIADVCSVSMPDTVVRSLPSYAAAPAPSILPPGTDPAANNTSSGDGTCSGQTVAVTGTQVRSIDRDEQHGEASSSAVGRVKRASSGSCDSLSTTYGVPTGDLQVIAGSDDCSSDASSLCLPLACQVSQVLANQSCASIAVSLSSSTVNVTKALFLQWNPNIIGLCDNLTPGQYICTGPPGGGYVLPAPINSADTDASSQNRGGQGPQGVTPSPNSTLSAPTQSGMVSDCNAYAYASTNDTCYDMATRFGITLAQLTLWNPVLGYPDGVNCTTQFWAGYDYCVGTPSSGSTTITTTSSTVSATTSLPYPTQTGIDPACNNYVEAVAGDYCYIFAQNNNITTDQLYAWNKVLGDGGANCGTAFQAGYDYCVGVSTTTATATATSSTTTTASSAAPTQTGLEPACNKIVVAQPGDYCYQFASDNGISTTELYDWNPVLGANGANCGTQFQAGVGYCVGVPTQSGLASNCVSIVVARSGDYCFAFAENNGIATSDLYTWNPVLGTDGANCETQFQAGVGYCVSVGATGSKR